MSKKNSIRILEKQNVIEIRKLCNENNLTQTEISKLYNVCQQTISDIKNRKIWKLL